LARLAVQAARNLGQRHVIEHKAPVDPGRRCADIGRDHSGPLTCAKSLAGRKQHAATGLADGLHPQGALKQIYAKAGGIGIDIELGAQNGQPMICDRNLERPGSVLGDSVKSLARQLTNVATGAVHSHLDPTAAAQHDVAAVG
jgi:hypothetical protein